jgi:transposase
VARKPSRDARRRSHSCATTTPTVRRAIQGSEETNIALAKRYRLNRKTIAKWKARVYISDERMGPKLIEMPELGALEAGQAASLVGLAPIARQSGRWTGRAFIRGGRAGLRQALYMPARAAARFNPDLKAKYVHLVEAGKPAKVALTPIMRKLIVLANALLKAKRKWAPKHP